mmetsp:Transcript_9315/g.13850  ORF Transcript_9315/g.13850 Transcript_9315/m.13850 type:complete len:374 (-) Transcript_9315:354-1475(-)
MKDVNDEPLALSELGDRISKKTFVWLQSADEEEAKRNAELQDDEAISYATVLFQQSADDDSEEKYERVQEWCSSLTNPDGIGGTNVYDDGEEDEEAVHSNAEVGGSALSVKYILSEASGGHGDDLWAAARHIANLFADPVKCKKLLSPLFHTATSENHEERQNSSTCSRNNAERHPLLGKAVIELGAGAGVPSWIAMKCGARVVSTDQSIPNRIRCMAECAQRNLYEMKMTCENNNNSQGQEALHNAEKVKVCPYDWGNSIDEIIETFNDHGKNGNDTDSCFDVVIAADCIYMPHCHSLLLDSIKLLLRKKTGVALLPFALHGNTKDEYVWSIVDLAKEKGFEVAVLEPQQLTPQGAFMESKRALVNMLQLTL